MDHETQDLIGNLGLYLLIISVLVLGLFFKRMPKAIQVLGGYFLLNLVIQYYADYLWQERMNNLPLLHLNTLFELIFISWFFREIYIDQHFFKKHYVSLIGGLVLVLAANSIWFESIYEFNSNGKTMVQIVIIVFVILYFFDAYGRVDFSKTEAQAFSFICFAFLLYYSGSLFIFMFGQFFAGNNNEIYRHFWILNAFLSVFFQLFILISILKIAFQAQISRKLRTLLSK